MVQRCTECNLSQRDLQLQKHSGFSDGGLLEQQVRQWMFGNGKKLHVAHTSELKRSLDSHVIFGE